MKLKGRWVKLGNSCVYESKSLNIRIHVGGMIKNLRTGEHISNIPYHFLKMQGGNKKRGLMLFAEKMASSA